VFGCDYDLLAGQVSGCQGTTRLCPVVTVRCEEPSADLYGCGNALIYDEDALRCALGALRDGTPGLLEIEGTEDWGIFSGQRIHLVRIEPDESLLRNSCMGTDTGIEWSNTAKVRRADPSAFAACLEEPAAAPMYACMWDAIGAAEALPECSG
jgi:hypothetical protein